MSAVAIIPARLGSTRLPGKVLLDRTGRPLIWHVWEATKTAKSVARVVIATDDRRVFEVARGFGAEAVMTRGDHANGTSRLSEAAQVLGLSPEQVIVNVQGDEPEVEGEAIDAAVGVLESSENSGRLPAKRGRTGGTECEFSIGTVAVPFGAGEDVRDPNCVKVVCGLDGRALYFSRAAIPFDRDGKGGADSQCLRHVGLYAYRREFLERYVKLEPTALERAEQLEQLRALGHGFGIGVAVVKSARVGIDTLEQYEAFCGRVRAGGG